MQTLGAKISTVVERVQPLGAVQVTVILPTTPETVVDREDKLENSAVDTLADHVPVVTVASDGVTLKVTFGLVAEEFDVTAICPTVVSVTLTERDTLRP